MSDAARKTVAQALAPSTSQEDFEIFCAKLLAEHDDGVDRLLELTESTAALAKRAAQRARATSELLNAQSFTVSGASTWMVR